MSWLIDMQIFTWFMSKNISLPYKEVYICSPVVYKTIDAVQTAIVVLATIIFFFLAHILRRCSPPAMSVFKW